MVRARWARRRAAAGSRTVAWPLRASRRSRSMPALRRAAAQRRRSSSSATASRPSTAWSAAPAGSRCSNSALRASTSVRTVVNASISGDTTAGGLARLPSLLREQQAGARGHRARRQRRAARPAARDDARQPGRDGAAGEGRRRAGADHRHAAAARITGALRRAVRIAVRRRRANRKARRWCRSCSRALPTSPKPSRCSRPTASIRSRARTRSSSRNVWPVLAPLLK